MQILPLVEEVSYTGYVWPARPKKRGNKFQAAREITMSRKCIS